MNTKKYFLIGLLIIAIIIIAFVVFRNTFRVVKQENGKITARYKGEKKIYDYQFIGLCSDNEGAINTFENKKVQACDLGDNIIRFDLIGDNYEVIKTLKTITLNA